MVLTCGLTDGSAGSQGNVGKEGGVGFEGLSREAVPGMRLYRSRIECISTR